MAETDENQYLATYIRFGGKCREAMKFYHPIFGGELHMQSFAEVGYDDVPHPENIMHAQLISPDGLTFMATDGQGEPLVAGNTMSVALVTKDKGRGYQLFDDLSQGGQVEVNLIETDWGAEFGVLTDKFGVNWMFNLG